MSPCLMAQTTDRDLIPSRSAASRVVSRLLTAVCYIAVVGRIGADVGRYILINIPIASLRGGNLAVMEGTTRTDNLIIAIERDREPLTAGLVLPNVGCHRLDPFSNYISELRTLYHSIELMSRETPHCSERVLGVAVVISLGIRRRVQDQSRGTLPA